MNKEDNKFIIDQIRKDKIIYAIESCAVTLIAIISYLFAANYLPNDFSTFVQGASVLIALVYGLYMGIGNFKRLAKIKKLEKQLKLEISSL